MREKKLRKQLKSFNKCLIQLSGKKNRRTFLKEKMYKKKSQNQRICIPRLNAYDDE